MLSQTELVRPMRWPVRLILVACALAVFSVCAAAEASAAVLLGTQTIQSTSDSDGAGIAEAWRTTATTSGTLGSLAIYVDSGNTATRLVAGLYTDASNKPGTLLAQGAINGPTSGAWNTVNIPATSVTAGTGYWISILGPTGTLRFRIHGSVTSGATPAEVHASRNLTALPTTWTTGNRYTDGPLSGYGSDSGVLGPVLSVAPTAVSFGGPVGGAQPGPATVDVSNNGGGTLTFTAASDTAWLSVSPTGGTAPRTLQLSASTTGLAAGSYTGHVTVTAAGAGGSPATVTATLVVSAPSSSHDWLQIEHDARRTGQQTGETAISPANAGQLGQAWATTLDGKVTAQPLYAKTILVGGASHDIVVAATSANSIYALDAVSGAVLWRRSLGTQTNANCAIPGGYGVTAAPVIDRAAGRVYTVADNGSLRSLALADGSDAAPALAVIPNSATNKVWGGLTLNGTDLYVSTASDGCDTPPWRGAAYRIDVSAANPRLVSSWTVVPSIAAPNGGGGVWGYGGVSADPTTGNVYAATGADSNEAYRDYANSMVALNANLGVLGFYQPPEPNNFPCNGAPCDLDFGSTPLVFTPPGCPTLVATGNKNGNIYVERATDLAASANPFQTLMVNATNDWLGDGGVGGTPAYWADGNMVFVGTAGAGLPGISAGIVGLRVGSDCRLSVAWSAGLGGNSQPNSTVTVANGVVFIGVGSTGRVHAFDAITGAALWTSGTLGSGSAAYAAPIVADGRVFAGSWNGVTAGDAGTIRAFALPGLSVSISAPANNATVTGSVAVSATASGAVGVQFKLDGNDLSSEDTTAPYGITWNTTTASEGTHTLTAVARSAGGSTVTSTPVTVTVNNVVPLTVSITAPTNNSTVNGSIAVNATASASAVGVQFRLDGNDLGNEDTTSPYGITWDTTTATEGAHTLTAVARNAQGATVTSTSVAVTVSNAVPLTVSITAPTNNSTVNGSIAVNAAASASAVGVQFRLDGNDLGTEDTTSPYGISWDTTTATDGSHTLTAVARNAQGTTVTSTSVTVTVANALTVAITAPANNGTVSGSIAVNATATGPVAGVQFRLDGANLGNEDTTSPYGVTWNTTTATAGTHTLTAVARNAQGSTVTSTPVTVTVNNSTPTLLVGSQTLLTGLDSNTPGKAEAFRTTATVSGGLTRLTVYIDTGNTATTLVAGIYTDASSKPGTLLAQGTLTGVTTGAWNTVTVPSATLTSGATYWIAILAPTGTVRFRDRAGIGGATQPCETSAQTTLTTLPATWTTGARYNDGPLAAYGTT